MEKHRLGSNIVLYQFTPRPGRQFGYNIYALRDPENGTALLIDTGYEEHASAVVEDLSAQGTRVSTVVISHFHEDHLVGLKALDRVALLGSAKSRDLLADIPSEADRRRFTPTVEVDETTKFTFGGFKLSFLPAPGHSACSQYVIIDDQWIHTADNVIATNAGLPVLPFVYDPETHATSLVKLKDYASYTLLPGHGFPVHGKNAVLQEIDHRLSYVRALRDANGPISYEEATRDCTRPFLHPEWHPPLGKR